MTTSEWAIFEGSLFSRSKLLPGSNPMRFIRAMIDQWSVVKRRNFTCFERRLLASPAGQAGKRKRISTVSAARRPWSRFAVWPVSGQPERQNGRLSHLCGRNRPSETGQESPVANASSSFLASKIIGRLARKSRLGDDGAVTSFGNPV